MNVYSTVSNVEPVSQHTATDEWILEDITDVDDLFVSMVTLEQVVEEEVQIPSSLNQGVKMVVVKEKLLKQEEKIGVLQSKLQWMQVKQEDKIRRIREMKGRKLTLKEKLHLKALKKSLLRLENKIECCSKLVEVRNKAAMKLKKQMSATKSTGNKKHQQCGSPIRSKTCWGDAASVTQQKKRFQPIHENDIPIYMTVPDDTDELGAYTNEELEELRRQISKKSHRECSGQKAREANLTAIYHLRRNEMEKVSELKEKLKWMEEKQDGKQRRIQSMKQRKASFDLKEKLKYKALKSSSKKLEEEISKTREEVMTRQENICKTKQLYTMSESQSLVDGELNESGVRIIRVVSEHSLNEDVPHFTRGEL